LSNQTSVAGRQPVFHRTLICHPVAVVLYLFDTFTI
jgi:hypothetical protein